MHRSQQPSSRSVCTSPRVLFARGHTSHALYSNAARDTSCLSFAKSWADRNDAVTQRLSITPQRAGGELPAISRPRDQKQARSVRQERPFFDFLPAQQVQRIIPGRGEIDSGCFVFRSRPKNALSCRLHLSHVDKRAAHLSLVGKGCVGSRLDEVGPATSVVTCRRYFRQPVCPFNPLWLAVTYVVVGRAY